MFKYVMLGLLVAFSSGCATSYGPSSESITGGYSVNHLEKNIYRVAFYGNGYTTKETVQTYWLYRCSELAIEKEFDGFEILSHISLTQTFPAESFFSEDDPYQNAQVYYVPVNTAPKPEMTADIRLLKKPIEENPPKVFDADTLRQALEPYVQEGEKCNGGNVCEHVHKYLHPDGTFDEKI